MPRANRRDLGLLNVALSFGVSTAIYLYLGYQGGRWLDGRLGTGPLFLMVGVIGAVFFAFWSLIRQLQADEIEEADKGAKALPHKKGEQGDRQQLPPKGPPE